MTDFFQGKKINRTKLLLFGFKEKNNGFVYNHPILNNQFNLTISIDNNGNVHTTLTEVDTSELYTLHLVEGVSGNFVGQIKEEFNGILNKIADECFEPDVFKSIQTIELIKYIYEKYNDSLEFLWEKFAGNAIVRRKDNAKWYAAFLTVSKQKLGFEDITPVEIIDLRAENADKTVDNKTFFPGYHMNKKHWITIILDGSVSSDIIKAKIDESFLIAKTGAKKRQIKQS